MKVRKRPEKQPGVEIVERRDKQGPYYVFRVRWKDPSTGKRLVETFDSMQDALDFRASLRLTKRRGALEEIDRGRITLSAFITDRWWPDMAIPTLEPGTLETYRTMIRAHLHPRIGNEPLRRITSERVARLRAEMERDGIGPSSTRKALIVLQSIMRAAAEWGEVPANPVAGVRKPKQRKRAVHPPSPAQVERVRRLMDPHDATLVSVLAYAGLRPQEAMALRWSAIGRTTILVEAKNVGGTIYEWQKGQNGGYRTVRLLPQLLADLDAYRPAGAGPGDLVFPGPDGKPWDSRTDWANWRNRNYAPARARVTGVGARPYDLRHAFASLLLHQGVPAKEVADELGHSLATLMDHYAHIIDDLRGTPPEDAAVTIEKARATVPKEPLPKPLPTPKSAGKGRRGPWPWWDPTKARSSRKTSPAA